MRQRSTFVALTSTLLVSLGTSLVVPAPASAETMTASITSPSPGDPASGVMTVTATSDAPYVEFQAYLPKTSWVRLVHVAPVVGDVATWDWATYGFDDTSIVQVRACTGPGVDCTYSGSRVTAKVSNPLDSFQRADGSSFASPSRPVEVVAEDEAPGPLKLRWTGFDRGSRKVEGTQPLERGRPTTVDFTGAPESVSATLSVLRCNPEVPTICSPAFLDAEPVSFRSGLRLIAPAEIAYSPNGDGVKDTATFGIGHDDVEDLAADWTLLDEDGGELAPPRAFETGTGGSQVEVDPSQVGVSLDTGRHPLRIRVSGTDHGERFVSEQISHLVVDVTPPTTTKLKLSVPSLYPYDDRYFDSVSLGMTVKEPNAELTGVDIVDETDEVVKILAAYAKPRLTKTLVSASWSGKIDGELAPEGTYRFVAHVRDQLGNTTDTTSKPMPLSHKARLHKVLRTKVSARSTLVRNDSGRCGKLRRPGLALGAGSVGYYSCRGKIRRGIASGLHRFKVPEAIEYRKLKLRVDGRPTKRSTGHEAFLYLYAKSGKPFNASDPESPDSWNLSGNARWEYAGDYPAHRVVAPDRSVYWTVASGYGQRYDVGKFKITLRYIALE